MEWDAPGAPGWRGWWAPGAPGWWCSCGTRLTCSPPSDLPCQTNRNHLTYILRPRRPAPRHSALNPTILTRVVSHTRPKKHLGLYFVVWRGESGEMPILGFRHEDSRDFLLCQPITPRWHISSFGTKSLSSTLAPRYQSLLLPHYTTLFRMIIFNRLFLEKNIQPITKANII